MTRRAAKDGAAVAAMIRQGIAAVEGPCLGVYVHRVTGEWRDLRYIDSGQATYFHHGGESWITDRRAEFDLWLAGAEMATGAGQ